MELYQISKDVYFLPLGMKAHGLETLRLLSGAEELESRFIAQGFSANECGCLIQVNPDAPKATHIRIESAQQKKNAPVTLARADQYADMHNPNVTSALLTLLARGMATFDTGATLQDFLQPLRQKWQHGLAINSMLAITDDAVMFSINGNYSKNPVFSLQPGGAASCVYLPGADSTVYLVRKTVQGVDVLVQNSLFLCLQSTGATQLTEGSKMLVERLNQYNAADQVLLLQHFIRTPVLGAASRTALLEDLCKHRSLDMRLGALDDSFATEIQHINITDAGYLVCGWMFDPLQSLKTLTLHSDMGGASIEAAALYRMRNTNITKQFEKNKFTKPGLKHGFVAFVPHNSPAKNRAVACTMELTNGQVLSLVKEWRPVSYKEAIYALTALCHVPDTNDAIYSNVFTPYINSLKKPEAGNRTPITIGTPCAKPKVSLIVPLYRNLSYLQLQAVAFAKDPFITNECELLFVLDSPEDEEQLLFLLRKYAELYGTACRLVVNEENLGYARTNNHAATHARANMLVLLNSDAIPIQPGWLEQMLKITRQDSFTGALLQFPDGSIQHDGLSFMEEPTNGTIVNIHPRKGMPFHLAGKTRKVNAVTGACMLIPKAMFDALGGLSENYIFGDFEDSDFCLKAMQAGYGCQICTEAVLTHVERQSMKNDVSYVADTVNDYNRYMHQQKWEAFIRERGLLEPPLMGDAA